MNDLKLLTKVEGNFSDSYIAVREKESRVYKDTLVGQLPDVPVYHEQYDEWMVRKKSSDRFLDYIKSKSVKRILDIGCGNGWFTNLIAKHNYADVFGIDVNLPELEQAQRVFVRDNLFFGYGDIFQDFNTKTYDIIVLNSCVQYFPNITELIDRLKELLSKDGEIHILDSPLYSSNRKIEEAKERTFNYYSEMGHPEMAENYYHHLLADLTDFKVLYQPKGKILTKLTSTKDSPFKWLAYYD